VLSPPAGNWNVNCPTFCTTTRIAWASRLARKQLFGGRPLPLLDPLMLFLKKHHVKTILAEYLDQSLELFRLLRESGIAFYVHAHGRDMSYCLQLEEFRQGYLDYAHASGIISCNQLGKRSIAGLGLPDQMIHVVNYGVDVPNQPLRRPCDGNIVRCVAVGRMTNIKAPLLLLESFRRAAESNPHLRLDYVGGGELFATALQYVRVWDLEDQVVLHGVQSSSFVARLLKGADIFLQHSVTDPINGAMEGLPVSILEAMALALPVVSTRHSGITEEVVDGQTGILVEEADVVGMAIAIQRLATDPSLRQLMGYAGHQRALSNFTWEKNRDKLRTLMGIKIA